MLSVKSVARTAHDATWHTVHSILDCSCRFSRKSLEMLELEQQFKAHFLNRVSRVRFTWAPYGIQLQMAER